MIKIINLLFGCRHRSWSWPMKLNGRTAQTCIDCGAKRVYNFKKMEAGRAL